MDSPLPQHIVLHKDDHNSKVFQAIARAFVAVDNRAMTIKDIAERASHHGLACQNLSAAAQAVTTYLRAHKARCDKQQDQPLLLSHTLSGTPADDHLVPALYSRSGGDNAAMPEGRLTHFRKGTAVWYLSRATGVQCPFTRVGIRLCEYGVGGEVEEEKEEKRGGSECGQKRKRPLRGCVTKEEEERPPKIKLTLRLKPLNRILSATTTTPAPAPAMEVTETQPPEGSTSECPIAVAQSDEDDESMDESEDETESEEESQQIEEDEEEDWSYSRLSPSMGYYTSPHRRSPSLPFATPPPDSDDEDFHVAMACLSEQEDEDDDDLGWDADLDSEDEDEEDDTVGESPGPRSPSAPLILPIEVAVKEEPRDVQGMLDAWDHFDKTVKEVADRKKTPPLRPVIKLEPPSGTADDVWGWDDTQSEDPVRVKQEEFAVDETLFPPLSPLSSLANQFAAFSYSDNNLNGSEPDEEMGMKGCDENDYPNGNGGSVRARAHTVPVSSSIGAALYVPTPPPAGKRMTMSSSPPLPSTALVTLLHSMSSTTANGNAAASGSASASASAYASGPPTPCVSPLQTRCQPSFSLPRPVVVTTCQPCKPPINATQIEDISVYHMVLGAFQLLRRIDTDFVNLSPIVALAGTALAPGDVPSNAMVVAKGSPEVSGTWVPLVAAKEYVANRIRQPRASKEEVEALRVFLDERLVERFPPALREFHRAATPIVGLGGVGIGDLLSCQFGRHFGSTIEAVKWEAEVAGLGSGANVGGSANVGTEKEPEVKVEREEGGPSQSFLVPLGLHIGDVASREEEGPLSATEQQLFRELCVIPPDWEGEGEGAAQDEGGDVMMGDETEKVEEALGLVETPPLLVLSPPALTIPSAPAPAPGTTELERPLSPMSALSDESPLSSPMSSPTITAFRRPVPMVTSTQTQTPTQTRTRTPQTQSQTQSQTQTHKRTASTDTQRPLRRSKRVADAALASVIPPILPRARSRKGGTSRNSLS